MTRRRSARTAAIALIVPSRRRSDSLIPDSAETNQAVNPRQRAAQSVFAFGDRDEHPFVTGGGEADHAIDPGGFDVLDRFLELGGVASQIGAELPHVREQCVLVREESLRS